LVTTSWALAVASCHFVNKPEIFQKLRKELEAAIPDPALMPVDWLQLEKLPYLNGCVHEAVQLSLRCHYSFAAFATRGRDQVYAMDHPKEHASLDD
jgi:hypothetical protein